MFHTTLKFVVSICVFTLIMIGCESNPASNNDSVNHTTIESTIISSESALAPDVRKTLAGVRAATSDYHDVDNALADGYVEASPFIANMGYHYVNFGLVLDGVIDPNAPEALVYVDNPADDSKRRLVAVEYIYPAPPTMDPSELDGIFPGVDGDQWHFESAINAWALHAWIWYPNPDGIFHGTNPRVGTDS